jgi:predicted Zn-dependent protease with MMP-like domain
MRAPSLADIQAIAEAEIAAIPDALRRQAGNIAVQVVDFPDQEVCRAMELETPFDLLGLYTGEALTERSVSQPSSEPDMVQLYRRPLLDYWCESELALADVVRYVLVHEIGHHFGYSDDEMDALQGEP